MTATVVVNQEQVRLFLPMGACIGVVRDALAELAAGGAVQPLRPVMWLPDGRGAVGMMPGYLASIDVIGVKTITVFPGNAGTPYDSHQGTVMLFGGSNGRLMAVIDATEITAIRTAAASAVATDLLAVPDASIVAILGSGVQAASHIEAMPHVRAISEVRVWSRSRENADDLVSRTKAENFDLIAADSVEEAVAGAHIICTTTAAAEPVLAGDLLEPGMHINAVGSSVPHARELDGAAVARSRLFVDRVESAVNEAGDYLMAKDEGLVAEDHIQGEIGDILIGATEGRRDAEEITLFKSLGLAVEDVAAGYLVFQNATAAGMGLNVDLGGLRHG